MTAWRTVLLASLLVASFFLVFPSASACSLVGYTTLADLHWQADDRIDTNVGNGPGRVSLNTGQLLALLDQYSFASAASPDGRWLVASYFDGGLGADCSMEFVTTDAFDLVNGERVRLFAAATHAMAASDDHVFLSAHECGALVHRFAWGEWEEPERIALGDRSGAPARFEHITGLSVNADGTRLAVGVDRDDVHVYDPTEGLFKEGSAPLASAAFTPGPGFSMQGFRLAVVQVDSDGVRATVYDTVLHVERMASFSYPRADEEDRPAGDPAWRPGTDTFAFSSERVLVVVDELETTRQLALPSSSKFLGTPAWSPDGTKLAVGIQSEGSGGVSLAIYEADLDLDRRITWQNAYPAVATAFASWDPPIDDHGLVSLHTCSSGMEANPSVPIPAAPTVVVLGLLLAAVAARRMR